MIIQFPTQFPLSRNQQKNGPRPATNRQKKTEIWIYIKRFIHSIIDFIKFIHQIQTFD